MGKNRTRTRSAYRRFVEAGIKEEPTDIFQKVTGNVLLGSATWVDKIRCQLGEASGDRNVPGRRQLAWRPTSAEIERAVAEEFGVEHATVLSKRVRNNEARSAALLLIRKLTNESATDLANRYGGVSQAAISKSVKRAELRLDERNWQRRIEKLESKIKRSEGRRVKL